MPKLSLHTGPFLDPPVDFHDLVHHIAHLGYEGVEIAARPPHPNPDSHDTREKRQSLAKMVRDHGLEFSAISPGWRSQRLCTLADPVPYVSLFEKFLSFAADLRIPVIRVDTVEPVADVNDLDPRLVMDRVVDAFDRCAKRAADQGITVAWEFEPSFPLNKPSEILELVQRVRDRSNPNFGVLFDTSHAFLCSVIGANQVGKKETLPGGDLELLQLLRGKIAHVHLIDADGSLNRDNTSTHVPFRLGKLDFDQLIPEILTCAAGCPWWCIDLCLVPNSWQVAADARRFVDKLRRKYVS